jgi:hypothetical protein
LARFWYTHRWDTSLRQVAARPGRSLQQNARLYALVAMAEADALQAMAQAKLTLDFWRPITAIRNGDRDGNDATDRQADWEPLIKTPPHQEYPCGHCIDSMTVATVLQAEGPPPAEGVAVTSNAMPHAVLYVPSYEAMADQISESRIHAGAHFRSSLEAGKAMGRKIGEYAVKNFLTPAH